MFPLEKKKQTFALDIGTRTVVGVMLEEIENKKVIKKIYALEHKDRAMLDGQIHDITAVSQVIQEVKNALEADFGPLDKVSVAAAGRSLKTEKAQAHLPISGRVLQKDDVIHLELMAVQKAEQTMKEKFKEVNTEYFCVGYSVLYYYLNGEKIGNLVDQQGEEASVEIIATFLPKIVVDSLTTAVNRSGLEIGALTLEPIAAIHVLVPPSMRRLNVALVDIGAGTSDIAITDQNTIVNYGMVPIAGDEITEAISDQFLLDFPLAEQAKIELAAKDEIVIQDILGFESTLSRDEIIEAISPTINDLAKRIADEILQLNGLKAPKAVMLIGGGSLTPNLAEKIANELNLPKNRVAIRGVDAIQNITFEDEVKYGPELITPIGIAVSADKNPIQYRSVQVNNIPVRLFELKQLTVGECLLQAGMKMSQLYGKPGLAKIIMVNGKSMTLSGQLGSPPILQKNGIDCSIDDVVSDGDSIVAKRGEDGKEAAMTIKDLFDNTENTYIIDGKSYSVKPKIVVNGNTVSPDYLVKDKDQITVQEPKTISDLLSIVNLSHKLKGIEPFYIQINSREIHIPAFSGKVLKNNLEVSLNSPVKSGDILQFVETYEPTLEELAITQNWQLQYSVPINFNGEEIFLYENITQVYKNGQLLKANERIRNGDHLIVEFKKFEQFIFQDVFRLVDFQLPNEAGKYEILINGEDASFDHPIQPGDKLEIKWIGVKN
ncbi:cell division protein FtsA [Pallidibacillus pasinlerensis]|uniref:cell division protein FtsA n=1 Tax=Pallidibacillus pasinlerensis TaxID=2703818 RepID=UPI003898EFEB